MAQLATRDLAALSSEGLALRLATIPDAFVAVFDGDPCSISAEGNAGPRAPISCILSRDGIAYPQADVRVLGASFADPYDESTADLHPCSTYSHSCALFRAGSSGSPRHDPSCKLCLAHLRNLNADCAVSRGKSLSEREGQGESERSCAQGEELPCSQANSDEEIDTTEVQDPLVRSRTVPPHLSKDESSWQHEECGDSTEPGGSLDDYVNLRAVYKDACGERGVTHHQTLRSMHSTDYGRDPCLSDCSSAISMLTNTSSETTNMSVDYAERHWTDAKHGSYLNYMETNFVKNLYGREYCDLNVCGQKASKGSSALSNHLFEFKCWQSGDWCRRSMLKPPLPSSIPLAWRKSPRVDHFRHHDYSYADRCIRMENPSTLSGKDEEEEVNSPALEPNKGDCCPPSPSRSNSGRAEKLLGQDGSAGYGDGLCGPAHDRQKGRDGNEAMGLLEQFGHHRQESKLLGMKKRGFESGFELEPSVKCKRGR